MIVIPHTNPSSRPAATPYHAVLEVLDEVVHADVAEVLEAACAAVGGNLGGSASNKIERIASKIRECCTTSTHSHQAESSVHSSKPIFLINQLTPGFVTFRSSSTSHSAILIHPYHPSLELPVLE